MVDGGLISGFFQFFIGVFLKMGVLVHPQPGLLWPASLPFFFFMSLLQKNMIFYDFAMIFSSKLL